MTRVGSDALKLNLALRAMSLSRAVKRFLNGRSRTVSTDVVASRCRARLFFIVSCWTESMYV